MSELHIKQSSVIDFLILEPCMLINTHKHLKATYDKGCVDACQSVQNAKSCSWGKLSMFDVQRPGWLISMTCK